MPKVSVIIPVYNVEKYLRECLDSVKNQTLKDLQIICVDDGSTDGSLAILREYEQKDNRFVVMTQKNSGQAVARNEALKIATGDYIYFLDSDDFIDKETLQVLTKQSDLKQLDVLYFDAGAVFESKDLKQSKESYLSYYKRRNDYSTVVTGLQMLTNMTENNEYRVSPCLVLMRRSFLVERKIMFPEGIIHEDNLFALRCSLYAQRTSHIKKDFYTRRVRYESTMTRSENIRNLKGYLDCFILMLHEIQGMNFDTYSEKSIMLLINSMWNSANRIFKNLPDWESCKLMRTGQTYEKIFYSHFLTGNFLYNPLTLKKISGYPFVSIIMPVYNAERFLHEAIDSVINQTLKNIELICVDDGSTDRSSEILEKYALQDTRIKIIRQENLSAGAARNAGIASAVGEYLMFVDSDDFIDRQYVETAYSKAKRYNADLVLCPMNAYDNIKHVFTPRACDLRRDLLPDKKVFSYKDTKKNIFRITTGGPGGKMCKRSLVIQKGLSFPQNRRHSEDICFILPLLTVAESIIALEVNDPSYHYRKSLENNLESSKHKSPLEFYNSYLEIKSYLEKNGLYNELKISFSNAVLAGVIYNMGSQMYYDTYKSVCEKFLNDGLNEFDLQNRKKDWFIEDYLYHEYEDILKYAPSKAHYEKLHKPFKSTYKAKDISFTKPKVSIIIPVFNVENYIWECVDSLQIQTMNEFEMIFVDDGSDDHTVEILEGYRLSDPRIKIIKQANLFSGVARNNGMKYAQGKYLLFLDGDDFFEPELVEHTYNRMEEQNADICVFQSRNYDNAVREFKEMPWTLRIHECPALPVFSAKEMASRLFRISTPAPWNKMYRKSFIDEHKLKFQETRSANDLFFVYRAFTLCDKITLLDECLINYRTNIKTSLQATQAKDPFAFCQAIIKLKNTLFETAENEIFRKTFTNFVVSTCVYNLKTLQGNRDCYKKVYGYLHDGGFKDLGCVDNGKDYFYENWYYQEYFQICSLEFSEFIQQKKLFEYADTSSKQSTSPKTIISDSKLISISKNDNEAAKELNLVYASASFRIGRFMTFVPRKIRGGIRCYQEHGMNYTLRRIREKCEALVKR